MIFGDIMDFHLVNKMLFGRYLNNQFIFLIMNSKHFEMIYFLKVIVDHKIYFREKFIEVFNHEDSSDIPDQQCCPNKQIQLKSNSFFIEVFLFKK